MQNLTDVVLHDKGSVLQRTYKISLPQPGIDSTCACLVTFAVIVKVGDRVIYAPQCSNNALLYSILTKG